MLDATPIYKDAALGAAEDYDLLRREGLRRIEQLASRVWTDYNSHDPGITILEALCYAITDLGYRTRFEMQDLLSRSDKGSAYSVGRFHTAAEVMNCYPVSFDDLRKVLIDIRGVRNAWIYVHEGESIGRDEDGCLAGGEAATGAHSTLGGLFDVCIEFDEFVRELRSGPDGLDCIRSGQGNYIPPEGQGLKFCIEQDIVLASVSVYAADPDPFENPAGESAPGAPVPLHIVLKDGEGNTLRTWEKFISTPHQKTVLALDHAFEFNANACNAGPNANCYSLHAEGPEGCMWLFAHRDRHFPHSLPGYVRIGEGTPEADVWYFFYDWEWDTHESEETLGKWQRGRAGEADDTRFLSEYIVPADEAMVFDVEHHLILDAVHVFVDQPGDITLTLLNERGETVRSETVHVPKSLCKRRIPLCWEIPPCQNYRLRVTSAGGLKLCINRGAAFPYTIPGVLSLIGGEEEAGRLSQVYPFLYDWEISWRMPERGELDDYALTKGRVRREIWRILHAQRNLCEDPVKLREVQTEEIGVDAEILLDAGADVNAVHAEMLCRLEMHVKPPVYFYTLNQMLERGYAVEDIFTGPLLDHGFIDPEEFEAAKDRSELRASDIINLLMDIPGVKSVKKVRLSSYRHGVLHETDPWFLCLCSGSCCKPNFSPARSCFSFRQDRFTLRSDAREVKALLEEKRLLLRPVKLRGAQRDFPVPVGQDREIGQYWPMQHDLPAVYRVGKYLVPDNQPLQRKAQARQLKAYLMFFEQLLANYVAQLDHLHELFSWEPQAQVRTYFSRTALDGIEEADQLYVDYQSLRQDLDAIIEQPGEALERRNRFLDHLSARFAEQFSDYSLLMYQLFNGRSEALKKIIGDKEHFLKHYPALSAQRSRGFDYRARARRPGGFQRRVMALLGMQPAQAGTAAANSAYRLQYDAVQGWRFVIESADGTGNLFESRFTSYPGDIAGLFELMLMQGAVAENYLPGESGLPDCSQGFWLLNGPCASEELPALGRIPDGSEAARDRLIAWIEAYTPPAPAAPAGSDEWPDLANDYFDFAEDADGWRFMAKDGERVLFRSTACGRKAAAEQMLDAAIAIGSERENYRFDAENCRWELHNDCEEILGHSSSPEALPMIMGLFRQALQAEGLHIVEHILLRPRAAGETLLQQLPGQASPPGLKEPYSYQATAILPAWTRRSQSLRFRHLAEATLRREAPAHCYLYVVWVSYAAMRRFERAYAAWLDALQTGAPGAGAALTELLQQLQCLQSLYPPARLTPQNSRDPEAPGLGQMSLRAM